MVFPLVGIREGLGSGSLIWNQWLRDEKEPCQALVGPWVSQVILEIERGGGGGQAQGPWACRSCLLGSQSGVAACKRQSQMWVCPGWERSLTLRREESREPVSCRKSISDFTPEVSGTFGFLARLFPDCN